MQFPAMRALAEYNIGLTLLRQNREDEAIGHFEFARSNSDDRSIVALAETALRRINPDPVPSAASASQWTALLDFALGYDDNVALIDESTIPTGQTADSGFAELVGVFSGPIGSGSGLRFDGSLYAVNYMDAGEFDQTALRIGGFYHWRRSDWRFDIGPYLNRSTLAGDGFEQRLGLSMTARKQLGVSSLIRLRLTHATVDEIDSRYAFIAGSRNQLTLGWDKYGANGRLSLEYQLEDNDRADPGVSPSRNQVRLRYRYAINPKLRFDTSISLRDSAYDDLAVARNEDLTEFSVGLSRELRGGWELRGSYLWSDNDSSLERYSYSRNRTLVGISRAFGR
jgi:hypothetical protein